MKRNPPLRRRYQPDPHPLPYHALPFAAQLPGQARPHCWTVPPLADRRQAYLLGREYAGHYLVFLQDNPGSADRFLLARIAEDVDFSAPDAASACWTGFFHLIEQVLTQSIAPLDVFEYIDRLNTYEAALQRLLHQTPPQT